jgi:hypothetical protein
MRPGGRIGFDISRRPARPTAHGDRCAAEGAALTCLDMDHDAALPSGYFSKYLACVRNLGPDALEKVIKVLGVKIVLVPKGMLAFGKHVSLERNNDLSTSKMRKIAALGGKARWANVPPEDRIAHAQLIAEVRWKGETRRRKMNASRKAALTRRWNDGLRKFSRHVDAVIRANPPPSAL